MKYLALVITSLILASCVMSMTPIQFMEKLPSSTQSDFYDRAIANQALSDKTCKLLVARRSYAAPQGFNVDEDLRNGANGVDEWVQLDGGNAFVLNNFQWITTDEWGSTQLIIYFDTILCKREAPLEGSFAET